MSELDDLDKFVPIFHNGMVVAGTTILDGPYGPHKIISRIDTGLGVRAFAVIDGVSPITQMEHRVVEPDVRLMHCLG
ncbi:MAG: hypothetical protein M3P33_01090 [bacterium]|nr:hypothetical protein [bacterium]